MVAAHAQAVGRHRLAALLLEHETAAGEQVGGGEKAAHGRQSASLLPGCRCLVLASAYAHVPWIPLARWWPDGTTMYWSAIAPRCLLTGCKG